jgi:hypothetical protein
VIGARRFFDDDEDAQGFLAVLGLAGLSPAG